MSVVVCAKTHLEARDHLRLQRRLAITPSLQAHIVHQLLQCLEAQSARVYDQLKRPYTTRPPQESPMNCHTFSSVCQHTAFRMTRSPLSLGFWDHLRLRTSHSRVRTCLIRRARLTPTFPGLQKGRGNHSIRQGIPFTRLLEQKTRVINISPPTRSPEDRLESSSSMNASG